MDYPPAFTVITLWRAGWNDAQQRVLDWLCTEPFPDDTLYLWTVQAGSETAGHLEKAWAERLEPLQGRAVELVEVPCASPQSEVERHSLIAGLYSEVLSKVRSDAVLLVEDDVVPAAGSAAVMRETLDALGPETAAVMGAYRSRQHPDCVCAHDLQGKYVPWGSLCGADPLPVVWVGGGFTLHRTKWFKPFLPLEIRIHSGWVEGCDMRLSDRQRAQGGKLWVLPQIKAEHRCPEVLRHHG